MAFKMKSGKEGPMMKNFPAAFKAEKLNMKKIRVLTTLKPNFVEYKGKYYRSNMGKGFVPGEDSKPVSKQEAFNSKMVTTDELKQIRKN